MPRDLTPIDHPERSTVPGNPPTGRRLLYPKADGWYEKSGGVESRIGGPHASTHATGGSDAVTPAAIGAAQTIVVSTYANRPTTGLYVGMQIYEQDTTITRMYDGAVWRYIGIASAPWANIERTTDQSIAATTTEDIIWQTDTNDHWGMWSSGALVTVPIAGRYTITLLGSLGGSVTGSSFAVSYFITTSGNTILAAASAPVGANLTATRYGSVTLQRNYAAGAQFKCRVFHNYSSALTLEWGKSSLQVSYQGPVEAP